MAKTKSSKKSKSNNRVGDHWVARIIILAVLALLLGLSLIFQNSINSALGLKKVSESNYGGDRIDKVLDSSDIGGDLNIHFVDVGQGDACIIEFPDGKVMLIDAGPQSGVSNLQNYILTSKIFDTTDNISDYFDYAIMTHSDEDHCGGIDDVLGLYPSKVFYRPNEKSTYKDFVDPATITSKGSQSTLAYKKAIEAGYKANKDFTPKVILTDSKIDTQRITADCPNDCGEVCTIICEESNSEFYSLTFFAPIKNDYSDRNDYSPIMILEYKNKRIALSGDAEKVAELEFVAKVNENSANSKYSIFDDNFTVDVIKLGHHGSHTSSSEEYLNTLTTKSSTKDVKVVISCGKDNKYKHPRPEVLERLKNMNFGDDNILRTDVNGTVALSIRKDSESKEFQLYFGANVVRVEKNLLELGSLPVLWKEMAISIWVALALIILIEPLIKKLGKKTKYKKRR